MSNLRLVKHCLLVLTWSKREVSKKGNRVNAQSIYKSPGGEKTIMGLYDSTLAHWPVPYETLNIPTRPGKTFVITSGNKSAPPLILIHGAGSNSLIWAEDVIEYSRDYRVFAVDLLGEPGKSAPNRPAWDSLAYVEWLEDLYSALKINKAALIGVSQGGWTALKFAVHKPEHVEKIVLVSPGGIVPDKVTFVLKAIPLSMMGRWGIHHINRILLSGQTIANEVEEALTLMMANYKPRIGRLPIFTDTELQHLKMPILLLMGAQDALRDAEKISARLNKQLAHLLTIIIPNGGHALLNTTRHILPFLKE